MLALVRYAQLAAVMSSFALLRLRKRTASSGAAMARHALRDGGPEVLNADPERAGENRILVGPSRAADAAKAIRGVLPADRRKNAVEVVELLVTGSPEAMHAKSVAAQDAYFRDALAWIGHRFGGVENIKLAVVHRDETTPHMQVLLVPLIEGKLQANKVIGGPPGMRQMQTDFALDVGKPHNLERGIERKPGEARPSYQSIRRWYAAIAAAGGVDKIPPVRPVPQVPPEPERPGFAVGLFSAEAKARAQREYEKAVQARKKALAARAAAIKANKERTELVGQLATIGLAAYGKDARSVGERLAKAAQATESAERVVAQKRQEFSDLDAKTRRLTAKASALAAQAQQLQKDIEARREVLKLGRMEAYRVQLLAEIQQMEAQLRPSRPRPR